MRLWHYKLIPLLPRQQILGLHSEICGMRGKGWGRKHKTVDYVWKYGRSRLYEYHILVMDEMVNRGYRITDKWYDPYYRGKQLLYEFLEFHYINDTQPYPEHNFEYLQECIDNLKVKGIIIKLREPK